MGKIYEESGKSISWQIIFDALSEITITNFTKEEATSVVLLN